VLVVAVAEPNDQLREQIQERTTLAAELHLAGELQLQQAIARAFGPHTAQPGPPSQPVPSVPPNQAWATLPPTFGGEPLIPQAEASVATPPSQPPPRSPPPSSASTPPRSDVKLPAIETMNGEQQARLLRIVLDLMVEKGVFNAADVARLGS
jgi:hypothetical protein